MTPKFSVRVFGWLLRALPSTYTSEDARGMMDTFSRRAARMPARTQLQHARFVAQELAGLIGLVIRERVGIERIPWPTQATAAASLKLALRSWRAAPAVAAMSVVVLSLGIGANAAIFSLFHEVLFRSLPVSDADRLVNLTAPGPKPGTTSCNQAGPCAAVFSYPMFRDLERGQSAFTHLAAHRLVRVSVAGPQDPVATDALLVSGGYFPALGIMPAVGRLLDARDDADDEDSRVVVLSHEYWTNQFGAAPSVVGTPLVVNGQSLTIVGVGPESFSGTTLGGAPLVYVPLRLRRALQPSFEAFADRRSYWLYVFGRLNDGTSMEAAGLQLNQLYRNVVRETEVALQPGLSGAPLDQFRNKTVVLEPGRMGQSVASAEGTVPLSLLLAMAAIVLLVACANLANVLLARAAFRVRDIAIQMAIGAGRRNVLSQLLVEASLLSLAGGVGGLAIAHVTLRVLSTMLPPAIANQLSLSLDGYVIAFAGLVAIVAGIAVGLAAAVRMSTVDPGVTLSASGPAGNTTASGRWRALLVGGQVAFSMLLMGTAGLFVKTFADIARSDLGMQVDGVLSVTVSPGRSEPSPERRRVLLDQLEQQLARLPGVTNVSGSLVQLFAGSDWGDAVEVEGFVPGPAENVSTRYNMVGPDYFKTLGIPTLAGRTFTAEDRMGATRVAVVNQSFVRRFRLGPDAIGKRMSRRGAGSALDTQIVGIVADSRYSRVKGSAPPTFFLPFRQDPTIGNMTFYLRADGDPLALSPGVRTTVSRLDPRLPIEDLDTLAAQVTNNVYQDRFISLIAGACAVVATALAAIGLYGVLAYTVAGRTREFGIRLTLGAARTSLIGIVLREVCRAAGPGALVGLLAAWFLGGLARSMVFQARGVDPMVLAGSALLLATVCVIAGIGPAFRAARLDPVQSLRRD